MRKRRLMVALAILALVVVVLGSWLYHCFGGYRDWMPGRYQASRLDGKGTFVLQLDSDGSALWEDFPVGAPVAKSQKTGRWRLVGKVFIYEEGAAATKPIGIMQLLGERSKSPLMEPETWTSHVISADSAGLVLDLGGIQWTLQRVAEP